MTGILHGDVAVITGCSRGIGAAIAEAFAREGANLVLMGRDKGRLEAVADALRAAYGTRTEIVTGAISDSLTSAHALEAADRLGGATILVNNAGIFPAAAIGDTTDAMFEDVMGSNFTGTFNTCRALIPGMAARGKGAVVNISSIAARVPTPSLSIYAASKGAVEAFSRALAAEVAPVVRVNCVSPGPILTEVAMEMAASDTTGAVNKVESGIPLARRGTPEEVAEAVLFLASSRGSWTTGQVLQVNGGGLMA